MGEFLVLALQGEDLVFADCYVFEAILDVEKLSLESVDPLECIIVKFVVFFHPLEDLFGFDDVGVGLDVVVGLVDFLVSLDQQVALHLYDLREDAMGVQNFQNLRELFAFDQGGSYFVDFPLSFVLLSFKLAHQIPLVHIFFQQGDKLIFINCLFFCYFVGLATILLEFFVVLF